MEEVAGIDAHNANPYQVGEHGTERNSRADSPTSPFAATVGGAKLGLRPVFGVLMPIVCVIFSIALVPTAFGLGARRGFGLHQMAIGTLGIFVFISLLVILFGGVFGLLLSLLGRRRVAASEGCAVTSPSGQSDEARPAQIGNSAETADALPERRDEPSRRVRWRGVVITILGLVGFGTVAIAFGVGTYVGRVIDNRLANAIAEASKEDPHWRLHDLLANRRQLPDRENSALVVADVLEILPSDWPRDQPPVGGGGAAEPSEVNQAYDRLVKLPENVRIDLPTAQVIRSDLEGYADAVRLARTLSNFQIGRHELTVAENPFETRLPLTQYTRSVAKLLRADAAMRAEDGDIDGAMESCRALVSTGRSIGDEPTLISMLVHIACGGVGLDATRRVLGQGEPSDAQMASLQELLFDELRQHLFLDSFRGERAMLDEFIRRIRDGELSIEALGSHGEENAPRAELAPWGKLMFDCQRAVGLELTQKYIAIAKSPSSVRSRLCKAWEDELISLKKGPFWAWTSTLPVLMMPAMSSAESADSRYKANLASTVILLAAERHRRKTGSWPESIHAIDREILPDAPVDPFSDEPFHLEYRDGSLLIYSVGPNQKDEHGAYDIKRYAQRIQDDIGSRAWDVSLRRRPAIAPEPLDRP